jgi:hypothetical protein
MKRVIIGLLIGLLAGAVGTFLLFVGVPRSNQVPGRPVQPPGQNVDNGAALIVLKQEFFNEALDTIFRDLNRPSFPITLASSNSTPSEFQHALFQNAEQPCDGRITALAEGSGVKTSVRFENNRISLPLAFSGSYNSPVGCFRYTGWAQTSIELRFDSAQQTVFGRVNVETINLDGVNPILSGLVTPIVQTTLNNRVNPIQILSGKQAAVNLPIASAGGTLKAEVKDVRAEFKDNALNLYVIYEFHGAPVQ